MKVPAPTQFSELNHVLAELVDRLPAILGDTLVAIYVQGSHALGDADAHSDCDIIIAIQEPLTEETIAQLGTLHQALYDEFAGYWSKHLEGSYFPVDQLRRWTPNQPDLVYFDNGSTTLERSDHDNTQIVRWTLREHGVTLYGPEPAMLIDAVSAEALKTEVRGIFQAWIDYFEEHPNDFSLRWWQSYLVVSHCRMLQTLATGRVESKKAAVAWGIANLDPKWSGLIARSQERRVDQYLGVYTTDHPADQALTPHFLTYARALAPQLG